VRLEVEAWEDHAGDDAGRDAPVEGHCDVAAEPEGPGSDDELLRSRVDVACVQLARGERGRRLTLGGCSLGR
jgi:hypothetical protein